VSEDGSGNRLIGGSHKLRSSAVSPRSISGPRRQGDYPQLDILPCVSVSFRTNSKGAGLPRRLLVTESAIAVYGLVWPQAVVFPDSKPSSKMDWAVVNSHHVPLSASVDPVAFTPRTCQK